MPPAETPPDPLRAERTEIIQEIIRLRSMPKALNDPQIITILNEVEEKAKKATTSYALVVIKEGLKPIRQSLS